MELGDISEVKVVKMQFSFSNLSVVPSIAHLNPIEKPNETPEGWLRRKAREATNLYPLFIKPTENVSLLQFLTDLTESRFEIIDLTYQQKIDAKDPLQLQEGKYYYHMVHFDFVRQGCLNLPENIADVQALYFKALKEMCEQAAWRVRAYYREEEETISIHLEARKPFQPKAPKPAFCLRIVEGVVKLVDSTENTEKGG